MRQDYGEHIGGAHKERWEQTRKEVRPPTKQELLGPLEVNYTALVQKIEAALPHLNISPATVDAGTLQKIHQASAFDSLQVATGIAFALKRAIDAIPNPHRRWHIEQLREYAAELKWFVERATTIDDHIFSPLLYRVYGRSVIRNGAWNGQHTKANHLGLFGKKFIRASYKPVHYYITRAKNEGFLTDMPEESKIYPGDTKKVVVRHNGKTPVITYMATDKWPLPIVSCFLSATDTGTVVRRNLHSLIRQGKSLHKYERDALKRTNLDEHVRDGPEWFTTAPTDEEFMATFRIRGGEWGNYISAREREAHMLQLSNAFMDLAAVMGLPPSFIGFNGWLAIAIGSRGVPGSQAHFEPDKKVINLTKKQGAGALAHEWGHLTELRITNVTFGAPGRLFASEYLAKVKGFTPDKFGIRQAAYSMLTTTTNPQTQFAQRAAELDERTSREYWSRPPELFARAFEAYIESKCLNTYLVHGTRSGPLYDRGLYPEGEEARQMFLSIANYFQTVVKAVNGTPPPQETERKEPP